MLFSSFEKLLTDTRGAIHVGAHEGQERIFYTRKGFEKVLWFEPNTEIFLRLVQNTKGYELHKCFNLGIHDTLETALLHVSNNDGQSSSILELGTHKKYHPDVKYIGDQNISMMRMDNFLKKEDIDINEYNFLNIDVQGVELNVIKSFGDLISRMDYIYAEVNDQETYIGCAMLSEIDNYLKSYGFIRVATKMTSNHWGDAFYKRYE